MSEQTPTVAEGLFDGRYRLGRLVGRGGYASVHEAVDTALGRTVALKIIDGDGADPEDVARVRSEIRLLASLAHPSLVTLYDARLSGSPSYLVMELITGPTLSDRIARGPLPGPEVARVGRQIAEAFAVIHARGIVHRDVKPSNILSRPAAHSGEAPRAMLADFGIAALVGATRVTRADTVIGTAAYLSPEQAKGLAAAPASDVYALGLVLLEALTGTRPFGSRTPHESLAARLVSPPDIPGHIPPPWQEVLRRMTDLDPERRPDATGVIVAMRTLTGVAIPAPSAVASASRSSGATSATRVLGVDDRTRVLPSPDGGRETVSTRVLGGAEPSRDVSRLEGVQRPPDAERTRVLPPAAGAAAATPSRPVRKGSRMTVLVAAIAAVLLAVAGAVTAVALTNATSATESDLPTLPQPLDQHVDDLWKEVGP